MAVENIVVCSTEDFFKDAKPCPKLARIEKDLVRKANYELFDKVEYERNVDWSVLNSQIVGAEYK